MNLEQIKVIINSELLDDNTKKLGILQIIADDKEAIPYLLKILDNERKTNRELLLDSNAELSVAYVCLSDPNLKVNKKVIVDPKFVVNNIKAHYVKWKNFISCCFPIKD